MYSSGTRSKIVHNSKNCLLGHALGLDKASMLTHIYPHNPLKRLKWPYAITRLTTQFMCGLMFDLVLCKFKKSMIIHDIQCPYRKNRCEGGSGMGIFCTLHYGKWISHNQIHTNVTQSPCDALSIESETMAKNPLFEWLHLITWGRIGLSVPQWAFPPHYFGEDFVERDADYQSHHGKQQERLNN